MEHSTTKRGNVFGLYRVFCKTAHAHSKKRMEKLKQIET